ncbi:hypothetical protein BC827DRAFT_1234718 [Russula dissimulans]|nr:hypothetical protein BC827DRAFT_1234718 [Russula dissimulans]
MGFFKAVDAGSHLSPTNLLSGMFQKAFTYAHIVLKAGKEGELRDLYTNWTIEETTKTTILVPKLSVFRHRREYLARPRLLLRLRCDAPPPPPADSAPPLHQRSHSRLDFPRGPGAPPMMRMRMSHVSLGAEIVTGPVPAKRVPDELPELQWRLEPVLLR